MKYKTFEAYQQAQLGFHGTNDKGCNWIKIDKEDIDDYEHLTYTTIKSGKLNVRQVK